MFKEKENHFYIEEFENYGIKAIYSKKKCRKHVRLLWNGRTEGRGTGKE